MIRKLLPLSILLALSACGDEQSASTSGGQAEAIPAAISIGEVGRTDGIEFTVTKVTTPTSIEFGPKANDGETFVVAGYRLKNVSDRPLGLMERPTLTLVDAKGQSYNMDDFLTASAGIDVAGQSSFVADINPNIAIEGRAAWKVSKAAFDKSTWKLAAAGDPQLTFALQ